MFTSLVLEQTCVRFSNKQQRPVIHRFSKLSTWEAGPDSADFNMYANVMLRLRQAAMLACSTLNSYCLNPEFMNDDRRQVVVNPS